MPIDKTGFRSYMVQNDIKMIQMKYLHILSDTQNVSKVWKIYDITTERLYFKLPPATVVTKPTSFKVMKDTRAAMFSCLCLHRVQWHRVTWQGNKGTRKGLGDKGDKSSNSTAMSILAEIIYYRGKTQSTNWNY